MHFISGVNYKASFRRLYIRRFERDKPDFLARRMVYICTLSADARIIEAADAEVQICIGTYYIRAYARGKRE